MPDRPAESDDDIPNILRTRMSVSDLPGELWCLIFKYISTNDKLKCHCVSKGFRELTEESFTNIRFIVASIHEASLSLDLKDLKRKAIINKNTIPSGNYFKFKEAWISLFQAECIYAFVPSLTGPSVRLTWSGGYYGQDYRPASSMVIYQSFSCVHSNSVP